MTMSQNTGRKTLFEKRKEGKRTPAPTPSSSPISHNDSKGDQRKGFKLRLFW